VSNSHLTPVECVKNRNRLMEKGGKAFHIFGPKICINVKKLIGEITMLRYIGRKKQEADLGSHEYQLNRGSSKQ
jgi:hypothetical protein